MTSNRVTRALELANFDENRACKSNRPAALSNHRFRTGYTEGALPKGGTPPLVPMWPGVCVIEKNPFPFFPFNPRWRDELSAVEFQHFCVLLRLAWVSPRPCLLPHNLQELARLTEPHIRGVLPERVLARFELHPRLGMLYFPPQLRALERLIDGEDLYALLWDDRL